MHLEVFLSVMFQNSPFNKVRIKDNTRSSEHIWEYFKEDISYSASHNFFVKKLIQ